MRDLGLNSSSLMGLEFSVFGLKGLRLLNTKPKS